MRCKSFASRLRRSLPNLAVRQVGRFPSLRDLARISFTDPRLTIFGMMHWMRMIGSPTAPVYPSQESDKMILVGHSAVPCYYHALARGAISQGTTDATGRSSSSRMRGSGFDCHKPA